MSKLVLDQCSVRGHEQVCYFNYPDVGLRAIVGIHDTTLGPALGGCRMRVYSDEDEALDDVLRLSEGMTYKSALADLPLGGGKSCLLVDPHLDEGRRKLFHKFGECLNALAGRYITAEDMGTSVSDMMWIREVSQHVVGTDTKSGGAGDPSPWTALGVFNAMKAGVESAFPTTPDIRGKRVSVQGVGHVGMYLVEHLHGAGAVVTVADTNEKHVALARERFGVEVVEPDAIYAVPSDVFAPCAVGQTVNKETLPLLSCKLIAGAANNQLPDSSVYDLLRERGVVYCPDFVINSGGVICVCAEAIGNLPSPNWVEDKVEAIYTTTAKILTRAAKDARNTEEVAIELAKAKISSRKRGKL
jgi:leucine dehydrogenase